MTWTTSGTLAKRARLLPGPRSWERRRISRVSGVSDSFPVTNSNERIARSSSRAFSTRPRAVDRVHRWKVCSASDAGWPYFTSGPASQIGSARFLGVSQFSLSRPLVCDKVHNRNSKGEPQFCGCVRQMGQPSGNRSTIELLSRLMGAGWAIALSIAGGAGGGFWLDGQFDTSPVLTLVGLVIGSVAALAGMIRILNAMRNGNPDGPTDGPEDGDR